MARIARVVVPEYPHHVVQRGNRRQQVFFNNNDYLEYLRLLKIYTQKYEVDILAYCLMPNHVHLIVIPRKDGSLAQAIGETHRNYTSHINFREHWKGYLWQGRFSSYVLDERYLMSAIRYIMLNPVKAKIVKEPWEYKWSSVRHHMMLESNILVRDHIIKELITDWKDFLSKGTSADDVKLLQLHERTGRPIGGTSFIERLESLLKIELKKKKVGRKKK